MAKFCERLRELRMERGLKQREMAEHEQIQAAAGYDLYDRYFSQLMRYSAYELRAYYALGLGLRKEEQFGLAVNSYQCYEYATRYPEFPGLIAIADFFDVSLDYLVGRSDIRERR